jgi:hypothetical protein
MFTVEGLYCRLAGALPVVASEAMRRLLARCLLALAVAALAPSAYLHALTHVDDELARHHHKGDTTPTPPHACALCAAYAGADGGAAPAVTAPVLALPAAMPVGRPAEPFLPPAALTRFASRAPPRPA